MIKLFVILICFMGSALAMQSRDKNPDKNPVLCYLTFAGLHVVENRSIDFDASPEELLHVIEQELMSGGVFLSDVEAEMEFDDQENSSKKINQPTQKRSVVALDSKAYNPLSDK